MYELWLELSGVEWRATYFLPVFFFHCSHPCWYNVQGNLTEVVRCLICTVHWQDHSIHVVVLTFLSAINGQNTHMYQHAWLTQEKREEKGKSPFLNRLVYNIREHKGAMKELRRKYHSQNQHPAGQHGRSADFELVREFYQMRMGDDLPRDPAQQDHALDQLVDGSKVLLIPQSLCFRRYIASASVFKIK